MDEQEACGVESDVYANHPDSNGDHEYMNETSYGMDKCDDNEAMHEIHDGNEGQICDNDGLFYFFRAYFLKRSSVLFIYIFKALLEKYLKEI